MKIEAGKEYKTRSGHRARIYATDGKTPYMVHGAIFVKGEYDDCSWTLHGHFDIDEEDGYDLISEWKEEPLVDWSAMPAWANYVARDGSGEWWWFSHEPQKLTDEWYPQDENLCLDRSGNIPSNFCPNFTGNWEDSLVKRP